LVEKARNGTLSHTEFEDIKATYERKQSLKYDALKTSAEADRQKKLDSYVRVFQQQTAADA
jgi:hypothetical protein